MKNLREEISNSCSWLIATNVFKEHNGNHSYKEEILTKLGHEKDGNASTEHERNHRGRTWDFNKEWDECEDRRKMKKKKKILGMNYTMRYEIILASYLPDVK